MQLGPGSEKSEDEKQDIKNELNECVESFRVLVLSRW